MFILLCSPHSFLLIELLTTSFILICFFVFFFSRIVTEKPRQGSVNKLLYCIVVSVPHEEPKDKVEKLKYKKLEVMQPRIKNKS